MSGKDSVKKSVSLHAVLCGIMLSGLCGQRAFATGEPHCPCGTWDGEKCVSSCIEDDCEWCVSNVCLMCGGSSCYSCNNGECESRCYGDCHSGCVEQESGWLCLEDESLCTGECHNGCLNGECQDNDDACKGTCHSGCNQGVCVDDDSQCAEGYYCDDGECVEGCDDDDDCEECQICTDEHRCESRCEERCEICVDGRCESTCPTGYYCDEICRKLAPGCPGGCAVGLICVNGQCVPPPGGGGCSPACEPGYVCVYGECKLPTPTGCGSCPEHFECYDNECVCADPTEYTDDTAISDIEITYPEEGQGFCVGATITPSHSGATDSDIFNGCVEGEWYVGPVGDGLTYTWTSSAGEPDEGTTNSWTITTAGEYTFTVEADDSPLFDDDSVDDSITIRVYAISSVTADKSQVCLNEDVTFTASITPPGVFDDGIVWSAPGGNPSGQSGGTTFVTKWASTGTKRVTGSLGISSKYKDVTVAVEGEVFAFAGQGANGGLDDQAEQNRAAHYDNWDKADTGEGFLSVLEDFCGNCYEIQKLVTFSHGCSSGMVLSWDKGFYTNYYPSGLPGIAYMTDLATLINNGDVRFANNSSVLLQACYLGSDSAGDIFAQELSELTGGVVYGAIGRSSPEIINFQETGWFKADYGWRKWDDGDEITNPHLTDPLLSTPNQYGTNKLKCW